MITIFRYFLSLALLLSFSVGYTQETTPPPSSPCATEDLDSANFVNLPWYSNNIFLDTFKTYLEHENFSTASTHYFHPNF